VVVLAGAYSTTATWAAGTSGNWGDWASWSGVNVRTAKNLIIGASSFVTVEAAHYSHADKLTCSQGSLKSKGRLCIGPGCVAAQFTGAGGDAYMQAAEGAIDAVYNDNKGPSPKSTDFAVSRSYRTASAPEALVKRTPSPSDADSAAPPTPRPFSKLLLGQRRAR